MRLPLGFVLAGAICLLSGVSAAQVVGTIVAESDRDFSRPHDVVLSPDGAFLYVADVGSDSIKVLDATTLVTLGAFGADRLSGPHDMAFDRQGPCWSPTPTIIALRSTTWMAPRASSLVRSAVLCASPRASMSPPTARST